MNKLNKIDSKLNLYNLTADVQGGINSITWTVYGKIKTITKTDGSVITYSYDAAGNRISKAIAKSGTTTTTWYARDASGNVMAVYNEASSVLTLTEHDIYGSSRLGIWNRSINMDVVLSAITYTFARGFKNYELTNHLGNVLVTLSDTKTPVVTNNGITGYLPMVVNANDYYAFGMMQPGRSYTNGSYRYGFNGKEKSDEINGNGVTYDYGFRIYDDRTGRFLSVDPLTKSFY